MTLAREAELRVSVLDAQNQCTILWALSRPASLEDAWRFLDQAKQLGDLGSPLCLGALLMECEQRVLLEHEIQVAHELEGRVCNHSSEMSSRILLDAGSRRAAGKLTFRCIWCTCRHL
eukprot:gnl/TRDRNA2_/TRDRNA2_170322_c18_seq1.p2 gnl/TRDRNA2_/TRDRNA2_170322_c18~~gnl/TRDRNA2_/TRDRNA2_170322_c18_seq1.p2  ORF type:complete len:118 (-),score=19.16 gnl/TRDRNA2_/TRDRNA2_170322_c18_seq1:49-402(-)